MELPELKRVCGFSLTVYFGSIYYNCLVYVTQQKNGGFKEIT